MLNAKRMSDRSSSLAQSLLALSIVAVIAFTLGLLAAPISRQVAQTLATGRTSEVVTVAPATVLQPVAAVPSETVLVRVPYEAGWELYDGGWAGGPAYKVPALVRVPYEMGWELYDGGWAGGPSTIVANGAPAQMVTLSPKLITTIHAAASATSPSVLVRVPYEAGWELYDGGWAGGPPFKMPALVRIPYEMGWDLYDDGWAGGPPTSPTGYPKSMAGH